ncbi:MAG: hypothetical protein RL346_510 [Verrucomicrobiota bacterium]
MKEFGANGISDKLGFDPAGDFQIVGACGPHMPEEIGGVDLSVFREEIPVPTAAEHDIGIELPTEFATGFGNDAWEVGKPIEFLAKAGKVVAGDDLLAGLAMLLDQEIVPAGGGDQQGSGGRGFGFIAEIFDKVEKFPGFVADAAQKRQVPRAVVRLIIEISRLVGIAAAFEEFHE